MADIKKYEKMAKLDLSETERQWVSNRADCLISSFSVLDSIDAAAAEPLITVLNIRNVLRNDVVKKSISREELLSNAPEQHNGFFRLPRTLD
jgi:aspartyl-tRNA(Asn)/glutamyl-tRNA(Gln) amidotransferase subunit C